MNPYTGQGPGSNFGVQSSVDSNVIVWFRDSQGLVIFGEFTGAVPTSANEYQKGCWLLKIDATLGANAWYQNTGTSASPDFTSSGGGVTLLGSLLGADFNITAVAKVKYSGATGTPFQPTDVITGGTSAVTATIVSNNLLLQTLNVSGVSGTWTNGETITGTFTTINYSAIVGGPFQVGETVTDGTRTATVVTVTTTQLIVSSSTGTFSGTVTGGTSLASATIDSYVGVGSATLVSNSPAVDQLIALSGGSSFIITDIVIKNPSAAFGMTVDDIAWYSGTIRSGNEHANVGNMPLNAALVNVASYINSQGSNKITLPDSNQTSGSALYMSVGVAAGFPLTADVLVYGYVLA